MAKKPSKKRATGLLLEPESDNVLASIAGYTAGSAPYGTTLAELAEIEGCAAAKNSVIPPAQKEPVSLNDIVQEMQIFPDTMTVYFQRSTGKFITVTDEHIYAAESDDPIDDRPEWEQEIIREIAEILARGDDGDMVPLPHRYYIHDYALMEGFCAKIENQKIANDLFRAIRGKGAFRRFKDTLLRHGIEKYWYAHQDEAYQEIAREWCEHHCIRWRK